MHETVVRARFHMKRVKNVKFGAVLEDEEGKRHTRLSCH